MFLLPCPNGVLVSNVHNLYYSNENGTIFISRVLAYTELYGYFYIFNMIVFLVFEPAKIKLIKVYELVISTNINFIIINTIL
jgi:hypothetical protein